MTMSILAVPLTQWVFYHLYFLKICNMKDRLLINKMQSQIWNPLNVLNGCLYCDRSFINIDKSFINKPTFFNFVPQLINKTYRTGTKVILEICTCAIVVQANISLMTRLNFAWVFYGPPSIIKFDHCSGNV